MSQSPALNPRWVLCAQALGLDPTPRKPDEDVDERPGFLNAVTFMLWLSPRWEEFRKDRNMRRDDEKMANSSLHAEFDAWLRQGVEAGQWKNNPMDNPMDDRIAA